MRRQTARWAASALALVLVLAPLAPAEAASSGNPVFDKVVDIVNQRYYTTNGLDKFNDTVAAVIARLPELGTAAPDSATTRAAINTILASLGASHTGRYTRDQQDYYELADVFQGNYRQESQRVFPPRGEITYEGIGVATAVIDGQRFVTDVYDGGPADQAKMLAGDEILAVDGQPFEEIGSFLGKSGSSVALTIRRTADATPITATVAVQRIQPTGNFVEAIKNSAEVIEQGGRKIGVIRIWEYTTERVTQVLYDQIANGKLANVDGLVLDLRGRWGGTPADAGETFLGGTADMYLTTRDGRVRYVNERFRKPVVAIIDGGSRSGTEILAYSLKKAGVPLVGQPTAGDVLAATGFLLPDSSLLELAVEDVNVDGKRLEGNPVQPDISVPFDVRYANGKDPQFDAAVAALLKRLGGA